MPLWFRFLSHWPLWALHALGHIGGWLAWLLSPVYRRRFLENARQAGLGPATVWPAIGQAGAMSMELPRLWAGAPVPVHWAREQAAVQAYASGRGVLFLTPHLGCFEITAQALAERFSAQHGPLTVLFRPARKAWLAPLVAASRNRPGMEAVPTSLAGVRQMIKALRQGRAVGLLPADLRLGHGILAAHDPALMSSIRDLGITLEICPTSNLLTKALADEDAVRETFHRFVEHDVPFTIATDGPEMMRPLLLVSRTRHVVSELSVHDLDTGALLRTIPLPGAGTLGGPVERPDGGPIAWLVYTDHTTVPAIYSFDGRSEELSLYAEPPGVVDVPRVHSRQVTYTSADGTEVLVADMTVSFKLVKESFTSRVTLESGSPKRRPQASSQASSTAQRAALPWMPRSSPGVGASRASASGRP